MAGKGKSSEKALFAIEWPTFLLILACYASWAGIGLLLWSVASIVSLVALSAVLAIQASLMHEVLHGHPTRNARVNEALVFLPIGLVWPYRRFKALHLRHHADERLTDPFDDPESYYRALWHYNEMPVVLRQLLRVNNTMLGRVIFGPWLAIAGIVMTDGKLLLAGDRAVTKAWLLHVAGLVVVVPVIVFGFGMPLWLYALVSVWLGQAIISIRTFAEHQWSERPEGRTIIIERSPLSFVFLNNNLHLVHHKHPTVAWYRLPAMFRSRREEWLKLNNGYVFANYWALFRQFALKPKEPVTHPFLRRVPEAGRAFRPRIRSRSVHGSGSAPVPAKPPSD